MTAGSLATVELGPRTSNHYSLIELVVSLGFPSGSDDKESACSARDPGSISGWGRSPGEGHDYPLQYSCLENPMDRGAWWVRKDSENIPAPP